MNTDELGSSMYRWMRREMDAQTFFNLTGKTTFGALTPLEVDKELKNAFNEYVAGTALTRIRLRSNVRSTVLPKELGIAIHEYTTKCFAAGAGEKADVAGAFIKLCNEISRIL